MELIQGRSAGCVRPMIKVKEEKLERAANYARVMREQTMLGNFIRLADYMFVEGGCIPSYKLGSELVHRPYSLTLLLLGLILVHVYPPPRGD